MKHLILVICLVLFSTGHSKQLNKGMIKETTPLPLSEGTNNIMVFNTGLLRALSEMIVSTAFFNGVENEMEQVLALHNEYVKNQSDVSKIIISKQLYSHTSNYTLESESDTKILESLISYDSKIKKFLSQSDYTKAKSLSKEIIANQPSISSLTQRLNAKDFLFYIALAKSNSKEGKLYKEFNTIFEPLLTAIEEDEEKLKDEKKKEEENFYQKWFEALADDNLKVITKSIDNGIDLTKNNLNGESIFQIVANNNSIKSIPKLIEAKDFTQETSQGYYIILSTVKLSKPTFFNVFFNQLEKHGIEVNYSRLIEHISDEDDFKYLKELLQRAQLSQVQLYKIALRNIKANNQRYLPTFLNQGLQPDFLLSHDSLSWECIDEDNVNALEILLQHGASLNYRNSFFSSKESLLSRAIDWDKIKCVELLLKMNAPIYIIGKGKHAERMIKLKDVLLPKLAPESKVLVYQYEEQERVLKKWFNTAKNNDLLYVRQQVENGFDIDSYNSEGDTLLRLAIKNKSNLVDYLILSGASFPPPNTTGESLLNDAIYANDLALLFQIKRYIDNQKIKIDWIPVIDKSITNFHSNTEIFKSVVYFSQIKGDELAEIGQKVIDENEAQYLETLFTFGLRKESIFNGKSISQYAKEANKPSINTLLR